MSRQTRFGLWIACLASVIVIDPMAMSYVRLISAAHTAVVVTGITAGAVAITLLILTTPPDAIRLRPDRSVRLIGWITAWVFGISAACFETSPSAALAAAVVPLTAVWLADGFARRGLTPWWAGVLLWQPAVIGPVALAWPWVAAVSACLAVVLRQSAADELAGR